MKHRGEVKETREAFARLRELGDPDEILRLMTRGTNKIIFNRAYNSFRKKN
jgi:hypothetical protein